MVGSKHPFRILLAALVSILALPPVLGYLGFPDGGRLASLLMSALFFGLLLSALPAVGSSRARLIAAGIVAALLVVLQMLHVFTELRGPGIAFQVIMVLFLFYVVFVTFRYLFRKQRVTIDTIYAALSVYLLLGVAWAFAYSLVDILEPGSFKSALLEEGVVFMRHGGEGSFYPLYYSLVTLTTLGYGDIVPVSRAASMLAVLEAMTGQIYLAVLVGRLVGLPVAQAKSDADAAR
jgi:hypothetical protein